MRGTGGAVFYNWIAIYFKNRPTFQYQLPCCAQPDFVNYRDNTSETGAAGGFLPLVRVDLA
jgi:hypothetical protein